MISKDAATTCHVVRGRHLLVWTVAAVLLAGCGKTLSTSATEQLLASNAVDLSIAKIDFSPMTQRTVFFDTKYIKTIKGVGFVNADYIVSSLRQQLLAADCRLVESATEADFIVEARVGALGIDKHEITYGIPASNSLSTAAAIVPSLAAVPTIPELSVAKKSDQTGAAKISVFAFHRESREPVWQSGVSEGHSFAKDVWIAGAGPFQSGTIYDKARFAGSKFRLPFLSRNRDIVERGPVRYFGEHRFATGEDEEQIAEESEADPAVAKTEESEPGTAEAGGKEPAEAVASNSKPAESKEAASPEPAPSSEAGNATVAAKETPESQAPTKTAEPGTNAGEATVGAQPARILPVELSEAGFSTIVQQGPPNPNLIPHPNSEQERATASDMLKVLTRPLSVITRADGSTGE